MLTGFIILYLLLNLAVGAWSSRRIKNTADFTLAGRSLSATVIGVTIFATWFGSEFIMGVSGKFIQEGIQGIITDSFGTVICLCLIGFFYARQMYRLKIVTINDFFRMRFGPNIEMITSLINVLTYFSWIAAQLVALALLFNIIFGLPMAWGIIVGAVVIVIYTYIGGMWAVTITDLFQAVLIVIGLLVVMIQLLGETKGLIPVLNETPKGFFNFLPESGFYNWMDYLSMWLVFGIGTIPAQEIYQRVLSARSENAGVHGVFIGGILLFTIAAIPSVIALCINYAHPDILQNNDAQNIIPTMVFQYTSLPVQIIFFGALISAILSTASGATLSPATVIGENLIKPHVKNITDKQLLYFTRLCVIAIAIISATIAFLNGSIHDLVVNSVTLYLVCLIVPFTLGLYWKKASVNGAWAAIIAGGSIWLLCAGLETRIEPWMYGLMASAIAMVITSFLTPDQSLAQFKISKQKNKRRHCINSTSMH